jgi:predicted lipoprotein with Yx(FWY)xxD motif
MRHRNAPAGDVLRRLAMTRMLVVVTLTAVLGVSGFLAAGSVAGRTSSVAGGATRANSTVSLRKTQLGLILVNSRGHTLYLLATDKNGKSACSGSCAKFWPPLLSRSKPTAGPGVKPSLLGRTTRSNGTLQVTYNRHPLYTYAPDKQAGQTKGEGSVAFGGKWWAISAKGTAIVKAPATTTTTTTTTTTGTTTTTPCLYPPC